MIFCGSTAMAHLDSDMKEECLRKDLRFYFMNPCEKYRARTPDSMETGFADFEDTHGHHTGRGPHSPFVRAYLLSKRCFENPNPDLMLDDKYHRLKNISLGTLSYGENEEHRIGLKVCKQYYKKGTMFSSNETLNIDSDIETDCVYLDLQGLSKNDEDWKNSSFFRLEFYRLLQVEISFHLKGIDLQTMLSRELPDCYVFQNTANYLRQQSSQWQNKIYFDSDANIEECKDLNISGSVQKNTQYVLLFDSFVIVICLASLILCTRSIVLALRLRKRFLNFFLEKYQRHVCNADQWEFINGWYVLVIISDLMTIIGSILKMEIQVKNITSYDLCSILLGTSTLLVWVGVIRYLGYFQKYNVLILTMQASLPKVLRFCACAGMIYLGYTFCGWIVLGPYHNKFVALNTVSECLFSLVNGDDMFATFAQIQQKSVLVWLFSRLYLYSFISLFIYMILSLFIALITDSYDTIKVSNNTVYFLKKYQQNGFPVTDLQEFLKECNSREECQKESLAFLSCICCRRRSVLCLIRSPRSWEELLRCLNKESFPGAHNTQKSAVS
ncbi:hypothetical protein QTO34_018419 [Cnephaeus nilssonii]|uniref:Polycystin cation channel PKD1/PKD2 domain-containing protein n=1 Tax=Cnephaeus nilssonii TaxID=3371016 RepID=A0AA40HZL4_CNENI|nr:hypothetical protein QTO34_018419 [Eptesicus nilssonii]